MIANNPMPAAAPAVSLPMRMLKKMNLWKRKKLAVGIALASLSAVSFIVFSQSTSPSIPAIALSADPLYAPTTVDKPAIALALSVEFPTVGAQYVDPDNVGNSSEDETYSPTIEYLGYYDAESCYTYDDAGTGAPTGKTDDYRRFVRRGPALPLATPNTNNPTWTSRMCWDGTKSYSKDDGTSPAFSTTTNDAFSGNFLNWASNSAIDMLRLALTGGDRVIDTSTLTVLQRAMIPDGNPISMGNSANFPAKRLRKSGTSRAITSSAFAAASYASGVPYFGAVPKVMVDAATTANKDIWVANTLNRIYFGTDRAGNNSSGFGGYTLGTSTGSGGVGTVTNPYLTPTTAYPAFSAGAGFTACPVSGSSGEGVACPFAGTKLVLYGAAPGTGPGTGGGWITYVASGGVTCGNNMTGSGIDPINGVYKRCYYQDYTPPGASTTLTTNPYFYARVQVCDRDSTTFALKDKRYWGLCTTYSDGASTPQPNYKPTGVIQKYSDQLRLSAFGYLMDADINRYGGVLRAPMKYVGARTFDVNGLENTPATGNPGKEWDLVTGVFNANPDGNTTVPTADGRSVYLSGVVNYVNQFGRTGAVAGRYKTYDPIGELHYQAVRYLQGLQPTTAATSALTTDMYDGYPVFTTWTDPYGGGRSSTADYSCVKSNIVVIGDKNTWDYNSRLPSASVANNVPDIAAWQSVVQKFESNAGGSYVDAAGVTRTIANPNTANSSGVGSASGNVSLVGSAYWARTQDIRGTAWTNASTTYTTGTALQRPGLRAKTFVFDVNEYGGSNDASSRRTSNQLFRAAKYGGFETDPSNTSQNPYNTYGNPFKNEADGTNNNYVWADTDTRASRVGEANTYFLQSDARGVLSAFDDIFLRASSAARSIAGGAIQSKNLTQAGDTIYQGTFDTSDWSGDLLSIPVTVSSSNVVGIGATVNWTAATKLANMPVADRKIFAGRLGATSNPVAKPFTWTDIGSDTNTYMKDALNKANPSASPDNLAQDRLNYLRGDRSKEGNPFRTRNKLMGDVINSGVVYSGPPSSQINDAGYSTFYNTYASRAPAVFVGANDGMMHAFHGGSGVELFAYIPSWMAPKLSALTSSTYATSHQSYVDGTAAVSEALVGSNWKTVLVSGTGAGGKGVFALDVSNPAAFDDTKVMWEFTNADDPALGNVVGRPQILKLRVSGSGTTATYKWFAVIASGVNNYVSDNGTFSAGNPTLFLLDLSKAVGDAWIAGTNYYKITLPIDGTLSSTKPTGLLNFRAVLGSAREVQYIFMGDMHGSMWKLDFTPAAATPTNWNMDYLSFYKKNDNSAMPMFNARDTGGAVQPISAAPTLAYGPTAGSFYVMFGTGKYLEVADRTSSATQSVYMLYDTGSNVPDTSATTATVAISGRLRLKQPTSVTGGVVTFPSFGLGRAADDIDTNNPRSGWVFNLPNARERQINNGTIFGDRQIVNGVLSNGKVIFGSLIPASGTTTACAATSGGGNVYTLDIAGGSGTSTGSQVGILGEPLVAEISSATTYTKADSTGRRIKTITSQVFQQGSNGIAAGSTAQRQVVVGRLSWRQINNYQDQRAQATAP